MRPLPRLRRRPPSAALPWASALALGLAAGPAWSAGAVLSVDASRVAPAPQAGHFHTGTSIAPNGQRLTVNSRYLLLDGRPWTPVMGEFHYSRYPAAEWDEELAKMKLDGVDVVSTYIIWSHHEAAKGRFDWSGDRDLRRFVQLCARHGLRVMVRLGPWVHAEVRYGGVPEWVVQSTRTRSDDPAYLADVQALYDQIGAQLKGLLWKDGGPVIGAQIENEYNLTGPGQGRGHIARLKAMALRAGVDTPLYTVTGWDNTVWPSGEVLPVFGGYPDLPWDKATGELPPSETYAFRFSSRASGDLGAQTTSHSPGDADADAPNTPYLSAEFGAGMGPFYRRRTFTSGDDGAALPTVHVGSGVNMFGYYMFHGGRNPQQPGGLQESTATGGYNDLPLINYDLTSPIGQYGQDHDVLRKVRPFHYFLQSFGDQLAPMTVYQPASGPVRPDDLATPRFAVRASGDSGFLFFNNHVRHYPTPVHAQVQFSVNLAGGTITFPDRPVDIPTGAYFVWPINMPVQGLRLTWATAQPVTRIEADGATTYVFRSVPGVAASFAFDRDLLADGRMAAALDHTAGRAILRDLKPGGEAVTLRTRDGKTAFRLLLLSQAQAETLSIVELGGRKRLLLTSAQVVGDGSGLRLRSKEGPAFQFGLYPAVDEPLSGDLKLSRRADEGSFQIFSARAPEKRISVKLDLQRPAQPAPAVRIGGPAGAAVEPAAEAYGASAAFRLTLPPHALDGVQDAFLQVTYQGDSARLFTAQGMIDDQFYDGRTWEVGLRRFAGQLGRPLTLTIMPLKRDAPIYLQSGARPAFEGDQVARVTQVRVAPQYELNVVPSNHAGR